MLNFSSFVIPVPPRSLLGKRALGEDAGIHVEFALKINQKMDSRILTKCPLAKQRPWWDGNDGV
jgi:hypothetical protein